VTKTTIAPGDSQTATAKGFQAGADVHWVLNSTPTDLGTTKADATGTATITFKVPDDIAFGSHQLDATGLSAATGQQTKVSVSFEVAAADSSSTSSSTPNSSGSPTTSLPGTGTNTPVNANSTPTGGAPTGTPAAASGTLPTTGGGSPLGPMIIGGLLLYAGYVVILLARRGRLKALAMGISSGKSAR
jgi:hypothetical protein